MAVKQAKPHIKPLTKPISFDWVDNSSVKTLLDIISSILAEEYTQIAKNNPEMFLNQGE